MSIRLLTLFALALALALAASAALAGTANAVPCRDCPGPADPGPEPEPEPEPEPDPQPDPGPGPHVPVTTTESVTRTLTIKSARGRVTDESGMACTPGECTRERTFTRTCVDGACPAYGAAVMTLELKLEDGYNAKWDGCTPRQGAPTTCDVLLDADKTVSVLWTKTDGPATVDKDPVHDGGAIDTAGVKGTTVSGSVETRVAPGQRGAIRSTIRYSFRRATAWTEFTRLTVRHIPRGATTRVTCKGQGCPAGRIVSERAGSVDLERFTGRRYGVGAALTVRVSKPGKDARTTRMVVRKGKDPRITHP